MLLSILHAIVNIIHSVEVYIFGVSCWGADGFLARNVILQLPFPMTVQYLARSWIWAISFCLEAPLFFSFFSLRG
jgi:hypothetical protein